jgi:diguanylate cyclase (GGDEF)-like protein/PAS domain S-box-containing protein
VTAARAAVAAWAPLIECLPHAAWLVELPTLGVVAANRAALALLSLPLDGLIGQRADHLLATPEDLAYWDDAIAGRADRLRSDTVVCTADGRTIHVERSIAPLSADRGVARHCVVTLLDRSSQRQAEDEREELVAELQATLESTADGILVTDLGGRVRAFNRRFALIWGLPDDLLLERDDATIHEWMRRSVVDPEPYERRLKAVQQATLLSTSERLQLHSGKVVERVTRPLWSRGRAAGRVYSFRDLTERVAADLRIEELSLTDTLTGLPNRRQLAEKVAAEAKQSRSDGHGFALLVVDIDRFRQINDSFGHDIGDRVLLDAAQRIQGCLRERDVLARVGGDQFSVLVHDADAGAAEATARRVLNVIAQPCAINGAQFTLTCSIGVSLCPQHGQTIDDLVRHAESAMRAVKAGGRANYRFHQARAEVDLRSHMRLDHAMRQALVSGRFRLHYQPQVRLHDGALIGAEALIRWRDPELGEVSPTRFIPVAEDSGFIVPIGDWVLSQAVRQAVLWHQSGQGVPIAVNVSALQFQQSAFVDRVANVLAVSGLPPRLLELELTESILVRDAGEALQRLEALARLGVQLSIDDFGTGYSSLAYLKRFPIGKLKIDRSFVKGLPDDDSDAGIVRAILQMARALGMKVIAEGVETEPQRQFLQSAGCDEFQGFLFAPALDSLSFEKHLRDGGSTTAAPNAALPPHPHIRLVR